MPKAFVVLRSGVQPSADVARSILVFCRERLAPYKRVRRAEKPREIMSRARNPDTRWEDTSSHYVDQPPIVRLACRAPPGPCDLGIACEP